MLYQEKICTILKNSVLCFQFRKNDGLWTTTLLSFFSAIIFTYIVSKHTAVLPKKSYYFLFSPIKLRSFPGKNLFHYFISKIIPYWKCEKNCQTVSEWQKKKSITNYKKWSHLQTDIFCPFKFSIRDSVWFKFTMPLS